MNSIDLGWESADPNVDVAPSLEDQRLRHTTLTLPDKGYAARAELGTSLRFQAPSATAPSFVP